MLVLYFPSWSVGILYSAMYFASPWQRPQVSATCSGWTLDFGSDGGLMEWVGWQLTQTATLGSLKSLSRRPWTEVAYSATWSTRSAGLYRFMNCASEWHRPQSCGICGRCHSDAQFMKRYNPALRVDQVAEYATSVHG